MVGEKVDDRLRAEGVEGVFEESSAMAVGAYQLVHRTLMRQVAASAAGLEQLAPQRSVAFDNTDRPAGLTGKHRRHQSRRPPADYGCIKDHFLPVGWAMPTPDAVSNSNRQSSIKN